jgi:hypothetical protein
MSRSYTSSPTKRLHDVWWDSFSFRNQACFRSDPQPVHTDYVVVMSMEWDCVSDLRPSTALPFIPHMIHEHGAKVDDTDRIKLKNSVKNLSQCHFIQHKPHKA